MARLNFIWNLSRVNKRIISVLVDAFFIIFSFYSAYWVRVGNVEIIHSDSIPYLLATVIVITILSFTRLGLYRAILRYLTFHALAVVSVGTLVSAASVAIAAFYFDAPVPRSLPIIYGTFLCLLCGGSRLIVRVLVSGLNGKGRETA